MSLEENLKGSKWDISSQNIWTDTYGIWVSSKVVTILDNNTQMMCDMLWISIKQTQNWEILSIEWWTHFSKSWSVVNQFLADTPESNGKWNLVNLSLKELNSASWLLVTSNNDFSSDYLSSKRELEQSLKWTESYFIYIDHVTQQKKVINLWEEISARKVVIGSSRWDKIEIDDTKTIEFFNKISKILVNIPAEEQKIINSYFEQEIWNLWDVISNPNLLNEKLPVVLNNILIDTRISDDTKNIIKVLFTVSSNIVN